MLSWEWRCSWSSADKRCSNYIWVINNFIAYWGATYIRGFTVMRLKSTTIQPFVMQHVQGNNRENNQSFLLRVVYEGNPTATGGLISQNVGYALQWRHNERDGISNQQPHDCLLNLLLRRRSKKTSKLRVTGLCEGNRNRWLYRSTLVEVMFCQLSTRILDHRTLQMYWKPHIFGSKNNLGMQSKNGL